MLISLANDMLPKMISYNSLFQILSSANPNYLPDLFCQILLDTQVSLAPTHVIPSVRVIVQSVFLRLVCRLNFACLFLFAWGVRMRGVGGYPILHLPSWREPGATKIARNSFPSSLTIRISPFSRCLRMKSFGFFNSQSDQNLIHAAPPNV